MPLKATEQISVAVAAVAVAVDAVATLTYIQKK